MVDLAAVIQAAIESDGPIDRLQVRNWIHDAIDLKTVGLLYRLSRRAWNRIEPNLERDETCQLICRYLLLCISENPKDGAGHQRYEAAGELESWFDHLSNTEGTQGSLREVATAVTTLYLGSDTDVRLAIETGFLEHVFEQAKLRPFFSHWAEDERLRDGWQQALAWGEAHPDYMRGIREQLRAFQSDET
jgi:hypothetical protein